MLSVPIVSNTEVYGVVQMLNKTTGQPFSKSDEDNFKIFSVFCALAIRYSNVKFTISYFILEMTLSYAGSHST